MEMVPFIKASLDLAFNKIIVVVHHIRDFEMSTISG
jgi:hypothetical protein